MQSINSASPLVTITEAAAPSTPRGLPEDLVLITRHDACKMLGCGISFVDEITAAGELPVVRHSSRYTRIRLSDVRRFVERRTQSGPRDLHTPQAPKVTRRAQRGAV